MRLKVVIPSEARNLLLAREYHFYVYIMASKSRVLYIEMTKNLVRRVYEHRFGVVEGFTSRYNCARLIHFEVFHYVDNCISREKELKAWRRSKKVALIEAANPTWEDLAADWFQSDGVLNTNSRSLASLGMTTYRNDDQSRNDVSSTAAAAPTADPSLRSG
jgi:putative endonuclease